MLRSSAPQKAQSCFGWPLPMIGDVAFAPLAEDSLNSLYLSRLPVRIGELSLIYNPHDYYVHRMVSTGVPECLNSDVSVPYPVPEILAPLGGVYRLHVHRFFFSCARPEIVGKTS